MNIDNSIGMAQFSGELGGAAAIGGQQGSANGMAESPEGSLFQKLINQMLTAQNQTTVAASGNQNTGEQNKSGGIGDMLSELLAGGTLSNGGRQKTAGIIGEAAAEIKGASGEQKADENPGAMEMLQALMAGMTNAATVPNVEKVFVGGQTEKPAGQQLASINAAGAASGNPAVMEILKQAANNNAALQSGLNGTTVTIDGKAGLTETAEGMTALQRGIGQIPEEQKQTPQTGSRLESKILGSGNGEAVNGIASQTEKTVLTNEEAEMPKAFASENMLTPKAASGNQKAASEMLIKEEAAAHAEKQKQETAAADVADPVRDGFQNSVQGAVTTSDAAESGAPVQTVESAQPYSQIREEILSRLDQNGPTEFKMQLEPEDLGQIDIKLKLSEGKLVIDILAADSRTQALLTSQVDKLIASIGLQNVQVESVQVSQQMNSQTQDNSQSQGFTMNSAMDFSQRRQEQNRQEILSNGKLAGIFNQQQNEASKNETTDRIGTIRLNTHRMNYSV